MLLGRVAVVAAERLEHGSGLGDATTPAGDGLGVEASDDGAPTRRPSPAWGTGDRRTLGERGVVGGEVGQEVELRGHVMIMTRGCDTETGRPPLDGAGPRQTARSGLLGARVESAGSSGLASAGLGPVGSEGTDEETTWIVDTASPSR